MLADILFSGQFQDLHRFLFALILGPVLVKAENRGYYCAKKFNDGFLIPELTDHQGVIHEISI